MYLTFKFIYSEFQATGKNWDGSIFHMQMVLSYDRNMKIKHMALDFTNT